MPRSPVRPRSRLAHFFSGLAAFVLLVVLIGGLPLALLRFGGNPLPHHVPSWDTIRDALLRRDVSGTLFIRALDVVGWAAWAGFALSVLVEMGARLRGRRTVRLPGLGLQQRWAAGLLASVALMMSSPAVANAAPLSAHLAKPAAVAMVVAAPRELPAGSVTTAGHTLPAARSLPLTYEVHRGDYLGTVAERFGSDFGDARQLARDNNITNPNHIEAGWRITLPAGAVDSGAGAHAGGSVVDRPDQPVVTGPSTDAHQPTGRTTTGKDTTGKDTTGKTTTGKTTTGKDTTGTDAVGVHHPVPAGSSDGAGPLLVEMLEASGTLAAVVTLALIGIRRREQLQRRFVRHISASGTNGKPPRLMAATRADDIVRLDTALRVLAEKVEDWPVEHIPQIAGVWLDQGTATLLLAEDCGLAPMPFVDDPNGWALPANAALRGVDDQLAPLPALCTVGGRTEQHVLLDLEYLRVLSVGGDEAEALNLLRFITVELCHNVWSDDVRVSLAGFGAAEAGLVAIDPDRIRTQSSIAAAIDRFGRRLARAVDAWDESWTPEVLLLANPTSADREVLLALEHDLMSAPGVGMSLVVAPSAEPIGRYHVDVTGAGDLHIGFLGDAIVPAASLPENLLPEVAKLLAAARASGITGPLDLARAASRGTLESSEGTGRTVKLAGQHRHDGKSERRSFRTELIDLTKPRHVRPAQFGWNS